MMIIPVNQAWVAWKSSAHGEGFAITFNDIVVRDNAKRIYMCESIWGQRWKDGYIIRYILLTAYAVMKFPIVFRLAKCDSFPRRAQVSRRDCLLLDFYSIKLWKTELYTLTRRTVFNFPVNGNPPRWEIDLYICSARSLRLRFFKCDTWHWYLRLSRWSGDQCDIRHKAHTHIT